LTPANMASQDFFCALFVSIFPTLHQNRNYSVQFGTQPSATPCV
jgi:hypothetical protein